MGGGEGPCTGSEKLAVSLVLTSLAIMQAAQAMVAIRIRSRSICTPSGDGLRSSIEYRVSKIKNRRSKTEDTGGFRALGTGHRALGKETGGRVVSPSHRH